MSLSLSWTCLVKQNNIVLTWKTVGALEISVYIYIYIYINDNDEFEFKLDLLC